MAPRIAGRIWLSVIAYVAAVAASVATAAASPAHRFTIRAQLTPSVYAQAPGAGIEIDSHMTAVRGLTTLSGNSFALTAKLAESPLECRGDLIFRDNFESPVRDGFE